MEYVNSYEGISAFTHIITWKQNNDNHIISSNKLDGIKLFLDMLQLWEVIRELDVRVFGKCILLYPNISKSPLELQVAVTSSKSVIKKIGNT